MWKAYVFWDLSLTKLVQVFLIFTFSILLWLFLIANVTQVSVRLFLFYVREWFT